MVGDWGKRARHRHILSGLAPRMASFLFAWRTSWELTVGGAVQFKLRIEDTDADRHDEDAATAIVQVYFFFFFFVITVKPRVE